MERREQLTYYWSAEVSRRFWLMASIFYVGGLITNAVFVQTGACGFAFIPGPQPLFWAMILALLAFEWWAYRRFGDNMTRRTGVGLLVAHILLFEVASAVDCSATITFLYLLIPFMAYLFISRRAAILLALAYCAWFATYFRVFRVDPIEEYIFRAVIFVMAMIFSLAMGGLVKEVLLSQAKERRLRQELEAANNRLEAFAGTVKELGATEERNRLARDIHDSVGHYLAAVSVQLDSALVFRASNPQKSEQAIRHAQTAARDALRDVRASVGALRQSAEFFSLTAALNDLVDRAGTREFHVRLKVSGEETGFPKSALMALYRVAQEGLTNIQNHASASSAKIELHLAPEQAFLALQDNGKGFVFQQLAPGDAEAHLGLKGMRERLTLVGGRLSLESSPKNGTILTAIVPKQIDTTARYDL